MLAISFTIEREDCLILTRSFVYTNRDKNPFFLLEKETLFVYSYNGFRYKYTIRIQPVLKRYVGGDGR